MKTQCTKNNEYGFTLVEVLISLLIFTVAITGVITVSSQGSLNVNSAKNRVIATFLADEGIELARAMRDTTVVRTVASGGTENDGWDAFVLSHGTGSPCAIACDIDPTNTASSDPFPDNIANIQPCSGFCVLNYTSDGYYSSVAPGTPSIFSRSIVLKDAETGLDIIPTTQEVRVESTVEWKDGLITQSITQSETMFNWYH
jgi:prepilin-type N-terminal cleavage/methylation domain-containing protein